MINPTLNLPIQFSNQEISRDFLPQEWTTALKLDYLDRSQNGGAVGDRTLLVSKAVYNIQLALDGVTGSVIGTENYAQQLVGGSVLLADNVTTANNSTVNILTPNIGLAAATYIQAYNQSQTDLINELKASVNQLSADLNLAIGVINQTITTERAARQRAI
tara:strand:+ start:261 stop:743 length:483 start_codon:yes stop_codon:yes gene_type:complete